MRSTKGKADLEARVTALERIVAAVPLAFGDLYADVVNLAESIQTSEVGLYTLVNELLPDAVTDRAFKEWNEDGAGPGADAEFHKPKV